MLVSRQREAMSVYGEPLVFGGPLRGTFLVMIKFERRRWTFVSNLDKNATTTKGM